MDAQSVRFEVLDERGHGPGAIGRGVLAAAGSSCPASCWTPTRHFVDLVEAGVITGTRKATHRNKLVTTSAIGDQRLYDFVADSPGVEFHPVDHTNDPTVTAREPNMYAVNATLEVDFLGQCASESLGSQYLSSSGGQPDFARGP